MDINTEETSGIKKDNISLPFEEMNNLNKINLKHIHGLEKDSKVYSLKQTKKDEELFNLELELDEKFKQLHNEIYSMNENLREIKQTFLTLAKNFKNFVTKDELSRIKEKVNSFNFEELATQKDIEEKN